MSLFIGLLFKGSTISSTASIITLLSGSLITEYLLNLKLKIVEYTFLPYLDFSIFDNKVNLILYNMESDINLNLMSGIIIIIIYTILFLIASSMIFKKREL